jgi:transposase
MLKLASSMRRAGSMDKRFSTIPESPWQKLQLLPPEAPKPQGGRSRNENPVVLDDVVYRLRTGCQRRAIPREFGSGQTCHQRFQEWQRAGVFQMIFICMLHYYDHRRGIEWQWALCIRWSSRRRGGILPARTQRIARNSARGGTS